MASITVRQLPTGNTRWRVVWINLEGQRLERVFSDEAVARAFATTVRERDGRRRSLPVRERILATRAVLENGCWEWTGQLHHSEGYAAWSSVRDADGSARSTLVHRLSYEEFVGPIPPGLVIDHVCHNEDRDCRGGRTCRHRRCVNPAHLEAVTPRENIFRSPIATASLNAAKTHCPQGHAYVPENIYTAPKGGRLCRVCLRARSEARKAVSR